MQITKQLIREYKQFQLEEYWITRTGPRLHLTIANAGEHRPVVIVIPGIGWHAGFYPHLLSALRSHGYTALGVDLRGHGLSDGKRGDHLYSELIEDVQDIIRFAKTTYTSPLVLLGTSFGSSIAYYTALQSIDIDCLVLHDAWDFSQFPSTLNHQRVMTLLHKYSNRLNSRILLSTVMGARMIWNLWDNKLRFAPMLRDPLWHRSWTARSWLSVFQYRPDPEQMRAFRIPTLVITGDRDQLAPPAYSLRVFEDFATPIKSFVSIPRAGHMLFIEYVQSSLQPVVDWMDHTL